MGLRSRIAAPAGQAGLGPVQIGGEPRVVADAAEGRDVEERGEPLHLADRDNLCGVDGRAGSVRRRTRVDKRPASLCCGTGSSTVRSAAGSDTRTGSQSRGRKPAGKGYGGRAHGLPQDLPGASGRRVRCGATLLLPGRSRQGRWHRTPPPAEPWHGCIVSRDHPLEPAGPRQVPRAFVGGAHADLGDRSRGSRGQGQTRDLHGRARPGGSDTLRFMPIGRRRTRQSLGSGAIDLKLEVETSLELRPHGPGARDAAKANWPSVSVSMLDPGEDY
jgi:hypothetical protein